MSYPMRREVLVETFSFDPTRLEEGGTYVEKLGGGRYRFRAKSQHCGVKNRNNRVYPIPVWEQHTSPSAAFIKRVKARRVIGHLEHPTDGKSQMGMAAVLVVEVAPPNKQGEVWSVFETLSTPAGKIVASFIADGVGFGISSRGNGSVVNKGGIDEVQDDYEPITFDMVIDESTPGAEVHARRLKESLCALMESVGGDQVRAIRMDQELAEAALARDLLAEQAPPTGFSRFLLAYDDGSAHYRAYDNGVGGWDVWLHPHNLPPEQIVAGLTTVEAAGEAAKQHYRLVQVSGQKRAKGEAAHALRAVRETFSVRSAMPYSGTALKLLFTSAAEANTAYNLIQKAGFHADLDGENVTIYSSIEDESAAVAHLTRLLSAKGIEMQTESVGFIHRGSAVWEDPMTLRRLNEMPYGGIEEMPYGDEYDEPMYDADEPEDDDAEDDEEDDDEPEDEACGRTHEYAYEQDDGDDDDDDADDDEDDEDDEETDEMYGGSDDPEDIDLDLDVDEAWEDDMYGYYDHDDDLDEDEDGHVKVWFDEDDDPVEYHYYDEDGVLEAVVDADGDVLMEAPTPGQRAMFAKAFANSPRSKRTGKPKDPKQTAYAARTASPAYYRKFRKNWTKTKSGSGVSAQAAGKFGVRVKGGKGMKARIAKAHARRGGSKAAKPAEKISKRERKKAMKGIRAGRGTKRPRKEAVEQVYDPETGLIETWTEYGECIAAHDPDTGIAMFEHPDYDVDSLLTEAPTPGQRAMFAKAFANTPRSKRTGKPKDPKQTAYAARTASPTYYRKFRKNWTKTKSGSGVSSQAAGKYGVRVKAGKGMKARIAKAHARRGGSKAAKPAEKISKAARKKAMKGIRAGRGTKRPRKESYEFDLDSMLIEDETGLIYTPEMDLIGGLDEDGDIFFYDEDGEEYWPSEDELEEMQVGAHGGGTPVALRMKGTGQEGRKPGPGPFGAKHGGKHGVKARSGSPNTMRGGGGEDESYDPYTTRLEQQVARQQEIIDAYQDLQHAEAMEEAKASILGSHPELSVVESRLDRCQTAEEMRVEAEALLTLVESSRGTRSYNGGVSSGSVGGAPDASLLTEEQISTGFDAALTGVGSSDTASRVAAARRRRRLDEAQN